MSTVGKDEAAVRRYIQERDREDNTRLIALDGTWYFSSQNIHCGQCSSIEYEGGPITYFHSAITPVVVSPGHSKVVPLRPEFITPQDGHTKQDCEISAFIFAARLAFKRKRLTR